MYRALSIQDYDAVIEVLDRLYGVDSTSQELQDVVRYCLEEGDSRGLVSDDSLTGFILAVNYDTIPEGVFCKLFGCSSYADLPGGGTIHHALRNRWFVTYIISITAQDTSSLDGLIVPFTEEYGKGTIVADPGSRMIYNAYMRAGYTGVELGPDRFYVSHVCVDKPDNSL